MKPKRKQNGNSRPYTLFLAIPGGQCRATAENAAALLRLVPPEIVNHLFPDDPQHNLKLMAERMGRELLIKPRRQGTRNYRYNLEEKGMGGFVIECFLSGMNIAETVERVREEKQIRLSKSAVSRFRHTFFRAFG